MKILIIGSKTKYSGSRLTHLEHFSYELEKFGIESKIVIDMDFLEKSVSLNLKKKIFHHQISLRTFCLLSSVI